MLYDAISFQTSEPVHVVFGLDTTLDDETLAGGITLSNVRRGVTQVAGHAQNSQGHQDMALWGKRAGIRGAVSPHRLRHTFAQQLFDRTGDLLLVKGALHHRSVASTLVYAAWSARRSLRAPSRTCGRESRVSSTKFWTTSPAKARWTLCRR